MNWRRAAGVALAAALAWAAPGQPAPAIGDGAPQAPGHAWMVVPGEPEGAWLLHLPPRSGVERPGEPGSLRRVRDLRLMPAAIAAVDDRVYMLFEGTTRTVLSGRAVEAVGGLWTFQPPERLDAHAPLPEGGSVLGFVGTAAGPVALVQAESGTRLLALQGQAWKELALPETTAPPFRLVRWGAAPAVLDARGRVWARQGEAWSEVASGPAPAPDAVVLGAGQQVLTLARGEGGALVVGAVEGQDGLELARLSGSGQAVAVAPIGVDGGRLVVLTREPGEDGAEPKLVVHELSAATGTVYYTGEPRRISPVSAGEFRVLVLTLVIVMAAVVLVAVRPAGEAPTTLPPGTALAEPGRRLAATVIDLTVAVAITASVFGVRVWDVYTLSVLFVPGKWAALPSVLVVGAVVGAVMEASLGRTLGKLLMGCRVTRATPEGGRPAVWRSAVRNAVKWLLPPVPALSLLEPAAPHRGDALSGLVVVIDVEQAPEGA